MINNKKIKIFFQFRLEGIQSSMIKIEPETNDFEQTLSNNVSLHVVNPKRTNVVISAYTMTLHEGEPMHIYAGEDFVFMKGSGVEYRTKLNGIKQLQSDNILT